MQVAVGNYLGNGVDDRAITGAGFRPDLVMIRARDSAQYAVYKTSVMSGENALFLAYAAGYYTNRIQTLDADGFTIGTASEVNSNGVTYDWQAFADNGAPDFRVGYYLGDGTDDRNITGLGFQPDLVVVKRIGAWYGRWRTASNVGDPAMSFGAEGDIGDEVQALIADGFQVGTQQNLSGAYYQFFAFKSVAGITAHGAYAGDGTDDRSISGLGFEPNLVWMKRNSASMRAVMRPSTVPGDSSLSFNTAGAAADHIQALEADGFQVGTLENASGATYRWYAWRVGSTTPVITEKASADTGAATDVAAIAEAFESVDTGAAGEAASLETTEMLSPTDAGAVGESASRWPCESATELMATVDPAIRDRVMLTIAVLHRRAASRTRLDVMVVPVTVDDVLLAAHVVNQDFEAAAAGRVIAPRAEVVFG